MQNRASTDKFVKEFFTLAIPIAIGNLFTFGSSFASHLMTSSLGRGVSAGIFLSNQIMQLLVFAVSGIETVVTVLGSQSLGGNDRDRFGRAVVKAAALAVVGSSLLTIICITAPSAVLSLFSNSTDIVDSGISYLRILSLSFPLYSLSRVLIAAGKCVKKPSVALSAPLTSFALTVAIGMLTVGAPLRMGAAGAGISITLARAAELAVAASSILRHMKREGYSSLISPHLIRKALMSAERAFPKTLLPIMAGQAAWGAESLLVTALMSRFGGGVAAVSFGVATALSNIAYVLMSGASGAVGIMISHLVGAAADRSERLCAVSMAERIFILTGVIGAVSILVLHLPFSMIYRLSDADAAILTRLVPILALTFIATAYSASVLFGIIKSGGDVKFVLAVDLLSLLLLTLPVSLAVFRSGLGIAQLYLSTRLVHIFKCPIARSRLLSGRWAKRLTKSSRSGTISM